jgi:hypothetical protein
MKMAVVQTVDLRLADRRHQRTSPLLEAQVTSERVGNHEDVGKQDRGIETETPDRLQRDLSRQLGIEAEVQESPGLRSHLAILRQVAPGLAHHPDRWREDPLAAKHLEHFSLAVGGAPFLALKIKIHF